MTDLTQLTLASALKGMEKKEFSSAEITDAFLAAIDKARTGLGCKPAFVFHRRLRAHDILVAFGAVVRVVRGCALVLVAGVDRRLAARRNLCGSLGHPRFGRRPRTRSVTRGASACRRPPGWRGLLAARNARTGGYGRQ